MGTLPETIVQMRQNLSNKHSSKAAWDIINDYFQFFNIDDIKNELWVLTIGALSNDEIEQSEKGKDRYNMIFFYEYTKVFIEAIHTLYNNQNNIFKK